VWIVSLHDASRVLYARVNNGSASVLSHPTNIVRLGSR
jgi:hypothetical protein